MYADNKRINMFFPNDLLEELDEYADSMHLTRSQAIRTIIGNFLENQKSIRFLSQISEFAEANKEQLVSTPLDKENIGALYLEFLARKNASNT